MHDEVPGDRNERLRDLAKLGRWLCLKTVTESGAGHIGGPLSVMDLLVALYFEELRIRPEEPEWAGRDRLILSKGHSSIALYTVMALRGYFSVEELATFDKGDSRLQGHPDMTMLPGLDMSTGSLGQGLSVGLGMALGLHRLGLDSHVWVIMGDGELQEGMVWEALHTAPRFGVGNLTAIVDRNALQQYGCPATAADRADRADPWSGVDLAGAISALGWSVIELDGHDFEATRAAFTVARSGGNAGRPTLLLANTTKGMGLPFAENRYKWHTGIATESELSQARRIFGISTDEEALR